VVCLLGKIKGDFFVNDALIDVIVIITIEQAETMTKQGMMVKNSTIYTQRSKI